LILIGSGAYDVALPDDVVIIEDVQNVDPGSGVIARIPDSDAPGLVGQAVPTSALGVGDAAPTDAAPQALVLREGEPGTGVLMRMPIGGESGSVMQTKTAGALGVGYAVPVDTAPQGPVVRATQAQAPMDNSVQPPARPVNRLDRSQKDQIRLVPGSPTHIVIPAIAVDSPVVEVGLHTIYSGDRLVSQWETADYAVGFNRTSALPGKRGNTVMSGHNNINGEVFRNLSNVHAGDTIRVFVGRSEFRYVVTQKLLLRESGVSPQQQQLNALWIAPTADERLTLVSCWPYSSSTQRLIVIAVPKPNAATGKP